eukprot:1038391-Prorocentrum_minimum.AAC.1
MGLIGGQIEGKNMLSPCDWLPHQAYALFPPAIGSLPHQAYALFPPAIGSWLPRQACALYRT